MEAYEDSEKKPLLPSQTCEKTSEKENQKHKNPGTRACVMWIAFPYEKKGLPAHSCCKLAAMFAASLQQLRVRFGMQMRSCRTHVRLAATFPTNIQNIDAASCNHSCTCPAHKCC